MLEENLSWDKRKDKMARQIYGKQKLMYYYVNLCVKNNVMIIKQANICRSILLHVSLRKSTPEIGVKFFVFFTFFINFFMKTLIKSIIYCQTVPLDHSSILLNLYVLLKPLFSHINNIFAVNMLSNTEKIPSLIVFYKLFLS